MSQGYPELFEKRLNAGFRPAHIDVGADHTICCTSGGDVYGWGDDSEGQLGLQPVMEKKLIRKRDRRDLVPVENMPEVLNTEPNPNPNRNPNPNHKPNPKPKPKPNPNPNPNFNPNPNTVSIMGGAI